MKVRKTLATIAMLGTAYVTHSLAAVSPEEAKQLGATLTIWGAEKAGNKDGTIPAYSNDRPKPPANYDTKNPGQRPDPFNEKPLFSITAQNYEKYSDKLSEGNKAMFKQYPTYRMDIYPSHRTQSLPQYVLDNTVKNATACKTTDDGNALSGCYGGVPFPIPKTGKEAVWNHLLRYKVPAYAARTSTWMVDAKGSPVLQAATEAWNELPFFDPKLTGPAAPNTSSWKFRYDTYSPSRKIGEKVIIIDPLDWVHFGRRAYQYIPGQRRVKLAPDLAYDTPTPVSGGASTMDQNSVFTGALDRYDFALIGNKEIFLPYNVFSVNDAKACPPAKTLTKNFVNPDCLRWELHRVRVVGVTLKSGFRHILPKRTLYFDEDVTGAALSDDYDASGKIYRATAAIYFPMYEQPTGNYSDPTIGYDLQTGIVYYTANSTDPDSYAIATPSAPLRQPPTFYSPEAMAGEGVR